MLQPPSPVACVANGLPASACLQAPACERSEDFWLPEQRYHVTRQEPEYSHYDDDDGSPFNGGGANGFTAVFRWFGRCRSHKLKSPLDVVSSFDNSVSRSVSSMR